MTQTALITGGNRGLGLETARQLARRGVRAVITARSQASADATVSALAGEGLQIDARVLDVTDADAIATLARRLEADYGGVDILINNAGVLLDRRGEGPVDEARVLHSDPALLAATMETNVYGPWRLARALAPGMCERGHGRIVNVSSSLGQLSAMGARWPAYRVSKAALNALTRTLSQELAGTGVLVNSVCPGWVRTRLGGDKAPRTPAAGAEVIVQAATLPDDGPSGVFLRDGEIVPW